MSKIDIKGMKEDAEKRKGRGAKEEKEKRVTLTIHTSEPLRRFYKAQAALDGKSLTQAVMDLLGERYGHPTQKD